MQLTFFQLFLSRSLRFAAYITRGEFKSISANFWNNKLILQKQYQHLISFWFCPTVRETQQNVRKRTLFIIDEESKPNLNSNTGPKN